MINIYIWGTGFYAEHVYSAISKERCIIKGFIDSDRNKQGNLWRNESMIYSPEDILKSEYDFIILSMLQYESVENNCKELGIPKEKVISYWKDSESIGIFKSRALEILEEQKKRKVYENRLDSAPYEWGLKAVPKINSAEKLLKKILGDKSSLCRFGDGEFDIMFGENCSWFQKKSESLRRRLIEIIHSNSPAINIAIAQNFVRLQHYKEKAADEIRAYMSDGVREAIIQFLDMNSTYYDAYVTRPYIIYRDRKNADIIFPLLKKLWSKRSVILVEGEYGRMGINNDLFDNVVNIRRIVCPSKDAWGKYDKIKDTILHVAEMDDLICISLGPSATVLAYDLAKLGYQALDIGQIDNEYDWYLRGADERVAIEGKMVAEITQHKIVNQVNDIQYTSQVVAVIE